MFKFLKEKLKNGIKNISAKIEEEGSNEEIEVEKPVEEIEESKKGFFSKLKDKFTKQESKEDLKEEEPIQKEEIQEKETTEIKVKIKDEVEEYQKKEEIKEEKEELEKKEEKIQEKVEKKEIPKIQELMERQDKKKDIKKIEKEIEEPEESQKVEISEVETKPKDEPETQKKGFFKTIKEKITTKKINKDQFEKIFWDLEVALLENNVAVEVIEKIKDDLVQEIVEKPLPRGKIEEVITKTLKTSVEQLLSVDSFNLIEKVKEKKPFVICFVGINGSGKTTTIAKVAKLLLNNKLSIVLAASDTFRAASIEQLQLHADKLGVKLIKQGYGADPAAVAFDAVKYADSKDIDVVLVDTAGRIHSNVNLTDEMKKIIRVSKPDLKVFVGESITGNDCVEQAKKFDEAIELDAIVLSKADVDDKGGAAISVSYVTQKPIIYIGTGQEYQDLKEFDASVVMDSLGL
jgi:fused signal recognition particle receptor